MGRTIFSCIIIPCIATVQSLLEIIMKKKPLKDRLEKCPIKALVSNIFTVLIRQFLSMTLRLSSDYDFCTCTVKPVLRGHLCDKDKVAAQDR